MQCARYLAFPSLLASKDPSQEGIIRVIGRVEQYDIRHSLLVLQDPSSQSLQIAVDVSNLEPFRPKIGVLHQFIGEADYKDMHICDEGSGDKKWVIVKALLHRSMDGLNMEMYLKALEVRMKNLD